MDIIALCCEIDDFLSASEKWSDLKVICLLHIASKENQKCQSEQDSAS